MKSSYDTSMRPGSIVLTDWGANVEGLGKDPQTLAYELMLLSLLYDEILIQDEVFVLSNKLARWFTKPDTLGLFRKIFAMNSIVLLTHPLIAYPTEHLKNLAVKHPIEARAEYIKQHGTKAGTRFEANQLQNAFISEVESCIRQYHNSNRPVGSIYEFEIMPAFNRVLSDVLTKSMYQNWFKKAFRGLTEKTSNELLTFIEEPQKAVDKIRQKDPHAPVLFENCVPIFNRSFGFQIADLYPPTESKSIKRIIQTTFAAPFCWRENAVGRYSQSLREMLWMPQDNISDDSLDDPVVSVEAHCELPFPIPDISLDFPDVIQEVRESKVGRALRKSIRRLGNDINFDKQVDAWKAVADELSRLSIKSKPVKFASTMLNLGKKFTVGTVIKGLYDIHAGNILNLGKIGFVSLISASTGVLFDHGLELLQLDLRRQKFRGQLEKAVEFRCNWIPKPISIEFNVRKK